MGGDINALPANRLLNLVTVKMRDWSIETEGGYSTTKANTAMRTALSKIDEPDQIGEGEDLVDSPIPGLREMPLGGVLDG